MKITYDYTKLVSMQDYKLWQARKPGTVVRNRYSALAKYNPDGDTYSIYKIGVDILYPN